MVDIANVTRPGNPGVLTTRDQSRNATAADDSNIMRAVKKPPKVTFTGSTNNHWGGL